MHLLLSRVKHKKNKFTLSPRQLARFTTLACLAVWGRLHFYHVVLAITLSPSLTIRLLGRVIWAPHPRV